MATRMGYEAVQILAEGKTNRVICVRDDQIVNVDIDEGLAMMPISVPPTSDRRRPGSSSTATRVAERCDNRRRWQKELPALKAGAPR